MTQEVGIIMLPTKDESKLIKLRDEILYNDTDASDLWIPQHLYFISDEEIKEGDWSFCSLHSYTRGPVIKVTGDWNIQSLNRFRKEGYENKIIASTNPFLKLPLIPQLFLQEYVKCNGKIDKVRLELIDHCKWCGINMRLVREDPGNEHCKHLDIIWELKLTPQNEVIVVGMDGSNTGKLDSLSGAPVESSLSYGGGFSEEDINNLTKGNQELKDAVKEYGLKTKHNNLSRFGCMTAGFRAGAKWQEEKSNREWLKQNK